MYFLFQFLYGFNKKKLKLLPPVLESLFYLHLELG